MENVAVFLAAEAKRSWQHFVAINSAEKHLVVSSPAHFSDLKSEACKSGGNEEKNWLSASAESAKKVKDEPDPEIKSVGDEEISVVEPSKEGMDPAIMEAVSESLEEWEYITMEDAKVVEVDELSATRIQAECLVRELKRQAESVAASAALGRYLAAEHARRGEAARSIGHGEEFCRVADDVSNREGEVREGEEVNQGGADDLLGVDIFATGDLADPVCVSSIESAAVKEGVCRFEAPSEDPGLNEASSLEAEGKGLNFVQESGISTVEVSPEINGTGAGQEKAASEGKVDTGISNAADTGITGEQGSFSDETESVDGAGVKDGSDEQGISSNKAEGVEGRMDADLKGGDDNDDWGILNDKAESVEGRMSGDLKRGDDNDDWGVLNDKTEGRMSGDLKRGDDNDDWGVLNDKTEGRMSGDLKGGDDNDDWGVLNDKAESVEGRMSGDLKEGDDGSAADEQGVLRDSVEGGFVKGSDDEQGVVSADEAKSSGSLSTDDGCEPSMSKAGEKGSLQVSAPNPVTMCDASTNTQTPAQAERATSPLPPPPVDHTSSQTSLSCADLLARVEEMRELELLKVELHVARSNFNEEKSQRLVSEELIKIVQADVTSLTERNMAETMARLQAENELTDLKAEFAHTSKELKEKEERIQELEDTLKGTSLMVRKLEEQNASTLINRGGIDYMLQARLADGRAKEAEQKLQVLQVELLQSQGEVRMLLDRVSESSRDRAEMVSSKVHTQLMAIADEKVFSSERRAQIMEKEILELRQRLTLYEKDGRSQLPAQQRPGFNQTGFGFSGLTSSGLTGLSSYGIGGPSLYGSGSAAAGIGGGGIGGGIGGGGLTGLGAGSLAGSGLGGGLSGLGGGLSGLGGGLSGLGGGLSGLSGGYGMGGGGGIGGGQTGLTGMGSSLSPYSTYSSSPTGLSSQEAPSLSEQYNLHSSTLPPSSLPRTSSDLAKASTSKGTAGDKATLSFKLGANTNKENGAGSSAAEVNGFALPTFDPSSASQETTPKSHEVEEDAGSDSSNWSSSDEEEEGRVGMGVGVGVGGGGGRGGEVVKPVKPSTHSSLIAEWEWRAMNQDTPTSSNVAHPSSSPVISRGGKLRPPVAPKPTTSRHISTEPSSSFEVPTHNPGHSLQKQKPRGPQGRKLPRRWQHSPFTFN